MLIDNCPRFRKRLLFCKSQDVIRLCSQKSRAWIYVHPPTGRVLDGVQGVSSILNCARFGHIPRPVFVFAVLPTGGHRARPGWRRRFMPHMPALAGPHSALRSRLHAAAPFRLCKMYKINSQHRGWELYRASTVMNVEGWPTPRTNGHADATSTCGTHASFSYRTDKEVLQHVFSVGRGKRLLAYKAMD